MLFLQILNDFRCCFGIGSLLEYDCIILSFTFLEMVSCFLNYKPFMTNTNTVGLINRVRQLCFNLKQYIVCLLYLNFVLNILQLYRPKGYIMKLQCNQVIRNV